MPDSVADEAAADPGPGVETGAGAHVPDDAQSGLSPRPAQDENQQPGTSVRSENQQQPPMSPFAGGTSPSACVESRAPVSAPQPSSSSGELEADAHRAQRVIRRVRMRFRPQ
ncbi:hypothetical protein AAL_06017 [Moelleriella libera RCEF 2490]|uniref:Uncharacterized protein n=1 Tax=Moelleriella libera RCEF 2490 TaxID=1081109 RepID=A0A167ZQX7_9HYPO|nr:hypothetical protein AAL_06017 [Moelleriella libera RCEF 2490]